MGRVLPRTVPDDFKFPAAALRRLPRPGTHMRAPNGSWATQPKMQPAAGGRTAAWADLEEEVAPPSVASAAPRPPARDGNIGSGRPAGPGDGDANDEGEQDGNPAPQLDGLPARAPRPQRLYPYRHTLMRQSIPQCSRHCHAVPVRVNLTTGEDIKLVQVDSWVAKARHPQCTVRGWNPLGQQWEVGRRNNSIMPQPHGAFFFEGFKYECQFWMPGNMPPGRYIHRREFTARAIWEDCPSDDILAPKESARTRTQSCTTCGNP